MNDRRTGPTGRRFRISDLQTIDDGGGKPVFTTDRNRFTRISEVRVHDARLGTDHAPLVTIHVKPASVRWRRCKFYAYMRNAVTDQGVEIAFDGSIRDEYGAIVLTSSAPEHVIARMYRPREQAARMGVKHSNIDSSFAVDVAAGVDVALVAMVCFVWSALLHAERQASKGATAAVII